jgi:hypothetical protein
MALAHCFGDEAAPLTGTDDLVEIINQRIIERDVQTHRKHSPPIFRRAFTVHDAGGGP